MNSLSSISLLKRKTYEALWGTDKYPGPHLLLEANNNLLPKQMEQLKMACDNNTINELKKALLRQARCVNLHSLIFDEEYYEHFEFEPGFLYGISYVTDKSFTTDKLATFVKLESARGDKGNIKLIRMIVYVDLKTDFEVDKQVLETAAKAAKLVIDGQDFHKLEMQPVPLISIKVKSEIQGLEESLRKMRVVLSALIKVLHDEDVQLEGLALGVDIIIDPKVFASVTSAKLSDPTIDPKSTHVVIQARKIVENPVKDALIQNALLWSRTIPPAIAFLNVKTNHDRIIYILSHFSDRNARTC